MPEDIMNDLLAGHVLEINDDENARRLEDFISGQDNDPGVFDNLDEGLEED